MHNLAWFVICELEGGVSTGLLMGVKAALLFFASAVFFCDSTHPEQCLTPSKGIATVVALLGTTIYYAPEEKLPRLPRACRPCAAHLAGARAPVVPSDAGVSAPVVELSAADDGAAAADGGGGGDDGAAGEAAAADGGGGDDAAPAVAEGEAVGDGRRKKHWRRRRGHVRLANEDDDAASDDDDDDGADADDGASPAARRVKNAKKAIGFKLSELKRRGRRLSKEGLLNAKDDDEAEAAAAEEEVVVEAAEEAEAEAPGSGGGARNGNGHSGGGGSARPPPKCNGTPASLTPSESRRHSAAGGLTPLRPAVASILAGTAEESDDEAAGEEAVEHL